MSTVEHPTTIEPPCAVVSPNRAAGLPEDEKTSFGIIHNRMNIIVNTNKLNIEWI